MNKTIIILALTAVLTGCVSTRTYNQDISSAYKIGYAQGKANMDIEKLMKELNGGSK